MNIVFGAGQPTGSALVQHKLIRGVSFTGGTATGLRIRKDTIDDIGKHLSLELGGKNPTLVFADADIDAAIKTAAAAAFENQGEVSARTLCAGWIVLTSSRSVYAALAFTWRELFTKTSLHATHLMSAKHIGLARKLGLLSHYSIIAKSAGTCNSRRKKAQSSYLARCRSRARKKATGSSPLSLQVCRQVALCFVMRSLAQS